MDVHSGQFTENIEQDLLCIMGTNNRGLFGVWTYFFSPVTDPLNFARDLL
jgi:hypothetical protein